MSDKKIADFAALVPGVPASVVFPASYLGVTYKINITDAVNAVNPQDSTTITGILLGNGTTTSAATGPDLPIMTATDRGAVTTPPNDATKFLNGQGGWTVPPGSASGAGTVTSFSVAAANGFTGTVATATTTPALTIKTSITGLLKGNGTAISAAVNSDLPAMTATVGGAVPTPPNNTTTFLRGDGTFAVPPASGATGTVTSISFVNTNGFAATITNPTTTPALTLQTSITGMLKGNGTAISAASDGTDYISPTVGDARYAKINTPFALQNTGLNGVNLSSNGTWTSAAVAYAINAPIKAFQSITGPTPVGFGVTGVTAGVMGETRYDFSASSGECVGGYFVATGFGTIGVPNSDIVGVSGTAIKFNAGWQAGGHFDAYDHTAGGTSIGVNIEMAMVQSGTNTYGIVINDTSGGAIDAGILVTGNGGSFASVLNIQATTSVVLNFTSGTTAQLLSMTSATGPIYYAPGTPPSFINARIPIMIDGGQYYIPISNV